MLNKPTPFSLSPEAEQHCQAMQGYLAPRLPMSFCDYMQAVLYTPELGYYSGAQQKFGREGDFVTAPEISPLFGQCLANQCADILNTVPHGCILEFGAGTGKLCVDILKSLAQPPQHYYILELSARLRARQQAYVKQALGELSNCVIWLDKLPEKAINGVIIANEVLDAMPVERFAIQDKNILQSTIQPGLKERFIPAPAELINTVNALGIKAEQYTSEVNAFVSPWINSLSDCLNMGLAILIDYGFPRHEYYHPQRTQGTIMCHFQHHAHSDFLINPGLQDVTAHVDFTAVALAAVQAGFSIPGYTNQESFLINCGLADCIQETDPKTQLDTAKAIKLLTLPSEMGELFKVIALGKQLEIPLRGFMYNDRRNRL